MSVFIRRGPLAGTDGGQLPFFSPDGRAVGFFSEGKLKRIDVDSGTVLALADAPNPSGGGAWNGDGTILFVPVGGSAVLRIPEGGGATTAVPSTAPPGAFSNPRLLPDGRHFLFNRIGPAAAARMHGWLDIEEHVDYLSFRPSPGILTAGWVHPVLKK